MPVTDLRILFEVSHATSFDTKNNHYVFKQIYISPGDGLSVCAHLQKNVERYSCNCYVKLKKSSLKIVIKLFRI